MRTVNIHDAKTGLSRLLAEIEKSGKRIVICRNGEPIADLIPHAAKVSMVYAAMLWTLELLGQRDDVAKPEKDEEGQTLALSRERTRARPDRSLDSDF